VSAGDGFVALAWFDDVENGGNDDGTIDRRDAVYARLQVWKDADADGRTDAGELMPLRDAGILAIAVRGERISEIDAHGNRAFMRSTGLVLDKGRIRKRMLYDVVFAAGQQEVP